MPHPLLQAVHNEPKLQFTDRPFIVLLPPLLALPDNVDFDYLASHVIPLPIGTQADEKIQDPQPTPSLSASAVFSRIKSPRSPLNDRKDSHQRPRAQSSSHVDSKGVPHNDIILHTMNHHTLRIRNSVIMAGQGFAAFTEAKIVRESLLHSGCRISHVLLHLDRPLLNDGSTETMSIFNKNTSCFHGIELGGYIQAFCDAAIGCENLELLHSRTEDFLLGGHLMLQKVTQNDEADAALESFLMEQTYDVLFFKISQLELARDEELHRAFEGMEDVDFNQVGLPASVTDGRARVRRGITVLERIGSYRTPTEKIDCLTYTISQLSLGSEGRDVADSEEMGAELDSDALVPLLLLTLIRSQVPHLIANLTYMKNYTFRRNIATGRFGFALSSFEGILQYALQFKDTLAEISNRNNMLWSAVTSNDLETVKSLSVAENEEQLNSALAPKAVLHSPRDTQTMCNTSDRQGNNMLLIACGSGHAAVINYLLQSHTIGDKDVNTRGETPLMRAVQSKSVEAIEVLLRDSYVLHNLEARDVDGNTATLLASAGPRPILQLLLQCGAQLCVQNRAGNGPLHIACQNSKEEEIQHVLEHVPLSELSRQNAAGKTFFHLCRYPSVIENYLTHDALDVPDCRGRSPLLTWSSKGRVDIVKLILSQASRVDSRRLDKCGWSVLHHLANVQRQRVVSICDQDDLLFVTEKLKDMVNVRDRLDCSTALHLVASTVITANLETAGHFINSLVKAGAALDARNMSGERPIHVCRTSRLTSILQGLHLDRKQEENAWAVTRAESDVQARTVYYILCSQAEGEKTKEIRYEFPESFVPSLEYILDPLDVGLSPPPLCVMEDAVSRLDCFMDRLRQHPVLQKSEAVQMFVQAPELRKAVIHDSSFARRTLMVERICDRFPSTTDVESDDLYFFTYAHGTIVLLRDALFNVLCASRRMDLCRHDMEENATKVIQGFESSQCVSAVDLETIRVCASHTSDTMHVSPWEMFVNTFQSMHELSNGILIALQRPFSLFNQRNGLRDQLERQREAAQRTTLPWTGIFATLEQRTHAQHTQHDKGQVMKTLNDMERTGSQINQSHQVIADELAHFQRLHPREMRDAIRRLAREKLDAERLKLRWLTQTQMAWKR